MRRTFAAFAVGLGLFLLAQELGAAGRRGYAYRSGRSRLSVRGGIHFGFGYTHRPRHSYRVPYYHGFARRYVVPPLHVPRLHVQPYYGPYYRPYYQPYYGHYYGPQYKSYYYSPHYYRYSTPHFYYAPRYYAPKHSAPKHSAPKHHLPKRYYPY